MDNKTKIEDVVNGAAKSIGAPVELKAYVRFQLGEGIEREQSDFAAEVAAASGVKQ
jgi:elongation factor Ts